MDKKLTDKIKQDFDLIALLEESQWNHNHHYHPFLIQQLPTFCGQILEIGCGTGNFSRLLAKQSTQVLGIDLSPKMIEIAQQKSQNYSNLNFQVSDILKLDFNLKKFDVIVSIATVHHLPIEDLLPKLTKALNPGGVLLILDLFEQKGLGDFTNNFIAVPLNVLFHLIYNKKLNPSPSEKAAWREHIKTDSYLTFSEAQQLYTKFLPKAKVKKHLFWRYSVVWQKK